jgi:hypothetical protein
MMGIEDKLADEVTKLAPEVYKDLVKPAAQEVGAVAGRSAKFLLSPVRALLWSWEQIEQVVVDGVNRRFEKIPEKQRKTPDPEIAVPLIQSLTYTVHNDTLREMYLNLLANSMDTAMDKNVHPSFVDLIKQMSSLDAKVFEKTASKIGYQKIINPHVAIKNQDKIFLNSAPEWFIGWKIEGYDIFDTSASMLRLRKFGLIELMFDQTAGNESYDELKTHVELHAILDLYRKKNLTLELELKATSSILYVNEYGMQFKAACT